MSTGEGIHEFTLGRIDPSRHLDDSGLPSNQQNFYLAMRSNGYLPKKNGGWEFDSDITQFLSKKFEAQKVVFFGPNSPDSNFFSKSSTEVGALIRALGQPVVNEVIGKFHNLEPDEAVRIGFLLGGYARYINSTDQKLSFRNTSASIESGSAFIARNTKLAGRKSGMAAASASAMYLLSGKATVDTNLQGSIYQMTEAIETDPIEVHTTVDLGLSQLARLGLFADRAFSGNTREFPNISGLIDKLDGFPTIGAEFHFPLKTPETRPNFWRRLALLNMSQYQWGSSIQFCRNDQGIIEVRMNPSVYPITISNWRKMMLILPELKYAYFTITLNRDQTGGDFSWSNNNDTESLNMLRSLGMLLYASFYQRIPRAKKVDEIDYGGLYLGQTVRKKPETYSFTGSWLGKEGQNGQVGIYAGFGDNLPQLAYYLSMALVEPRIFVNGDKRFFDQVRTLSEAYQVSSGYRRYIFEQMGKGIEADLRLSSADLAGNQLIEQFRT